MLEPDFESILNSIINSDQFERLRNAGFEISGQQRGALETQA